MRVERGGGEEEADDSIIFLGFPPDPEERVNLSEDPSHKKVLAEMKRLLAEAQATEFQPVRTGGPVSAATDAAEKYGGYWGPFLP